MPFWRYLQPQYWATLIRRSLLREKLAMLIWFCLPNDDQERDDIEILKRVSVLVRWCETGVKPEHNHGKPIEHIVALCRQGDDRDEMLTTSSALHQSYRRLCGEAACVDPRLPWSQEFADQPPRQSMLSLYRQVLHLRKRFYASRVQWREFNISQLGGLIPVVSGFFLITGYLYNSFFLQPFGIEISRYFGLTDYLAASLDGIVPTLLAILLTFIPMILTMARIRQSHLTRVIGARRSIDVSTVAALVGAIIMAVYHYQGDQHAFIAAVFVAGIMFATIMPAFASLRFQRPTRAYFALAYMPIYLSVLIFFATTERLKLEEKNGFRPDHIVTSNGLTERFQLLAGNSLYLFLRNEHKEVVIIPIEAIERIEKLPRSEDKKTPTT